MALQTIRLEPPMDQYPAEERARGYEFTAPLDSRGYLDAEAWLRHKEDCCVRRFWNSTIDEHGRLQRHLNGVWAFAWPDEQAALHLKGHAFVEGEIVWVTEEDGVERPFCVAEVRPLN
jgi:hypothetical protein